MKKIFLPFFAIVLFFSGCLGSFPEGGSDQNADVSEFQLNFAIIGGFTPVDEASHELIIRGTEIRLLTKDYLQNVVSDENLTVEESKIKALASFLEEKGFWLLNDKYTLPPGMAVADAGNAEITAKIGSRQKSVKIDPFVDESMPQNLEEITAELQKFTDIIDEAYGSKIWLGYSPVQCGGNPWEIWFREKGEIYFPCPEGAQCSPIGEGDIIKKYYSAEYNIKALYYEKVENDIIVCAACNCPRGDGILLKLYSKDREKMVSLGWKEGLPGDGDASIRTDKGSYATDENIAVEILNNSAAAIFYGGCADYSLEKKSGNGWDQENTIVCVWEGIPKKLEAGRTAESMALNLEAGTYRLVFGYGAGCEEGKPMSQAECAETNIVYSEEFEVKNPAGLECSGYHYSNCPEVCTRQCVPSGCSTNDLGIETCTTDCEGAGSCRQ